MSSGLFPRSFVGQEPPRKALQQHSMVDLFGAFMLQEEVRVNLLYFL